MRRDRRIVIRNSHTRPYLRYGHVCCCSPTIAALRMPKRRASACFPTLRAVFKPVSLRRYSDPRDSDCSASRTRVVGFKNWINFGADLPSLAGQEAVLVNDPILDPETDVGLAIPTLHSVDP